MVQSSPSDNIPSIPSKREEVKRSLSENEGKKLVVVNEEQTKQFIDKFLRPRLRYNLFTQEVELDEKTLPRHENVTLSVEQRLLVFCKEEYRVIFENKSSFKRHLLDVYSSNYYHPVEEYLKNLFEQMKNNPVRQPTVKNVDDIRYSIWIKLDDFLS